MSCIIDCNLSCIFDYLTFAKRREEMGWDGSRSPVESKRRKEKRLTSSDLISFSRSPTASMVISVRINFKRWSHCWFWQVLVLSMHAPWFIFKSVTVSSGKRRKKTVSIGKMWFFLYLNKKKSNSAHFVSIQYVISKYTVNNGLNLINDNFTQIFHMFVIINIHHNILHCTN